MRRDGARLYPALPYTSYTYMSDADALAIKAYLFSLPPVRATPPPTRWLSVQPALGDGLLVGAFNPDKRFEPDTSKSAGMESRRLSGRSAGALRRMPYAAKSGVRAQQPQEIRRRADRGLARLQHHLGQDHRRRRLARRRPDLLSLDRPRRGHGTASGPMGEAVDKSLSIWRRKTSARSWPICAPCRAIGLARSAGNPGAAGVASHRDGVAAMRAAR